MTDPTSPTPSTSSVSVADGIPPVTVTEAERQQYRAQWPLTAGIYDVTDPVYAIPHLLGALEVAERALDASRAETAALRTLADSQSCYRCGLDVLRETSYVLQIGKGDAHRYCVPCWERLLGDLREVRGLPREPVAAAPTPGADGGAT